MFDDADWLRLWSSLAPSEQQQPVDWGPVRLLVDSAKYLLAGDIRALKAQLELSNRALAPLEDPFSIDFGLHRWLSGNREESYSDWLEYAVRQLEAPELVYGLFHLVAPAGVHGSKPRTLQREFSVEKGDLDRSGRLDLIVRYHGACPLVVEVKVPTAEESYTAKQQGYAASIGECAKVLLVTEAEDQQSEGGFEIRLWLVVAKQLRRVIPKLCHERRIVTAAMILAFAGAIEQNLCGLPAQPLDLLKHGVVLNADRVVSYVHEVLTQ